MKDYIVRKQIALKATTAEVWDALTNPEKTKEYFFNCAVHSDWKPGSPITFKGKIFLIKNIEMHGTIMQAVPGNILQYKLTNSDTDNPSTSTVTDELSYNDGVTTLTVTDDVGQGDGAKERYERSEKGWDKVLKGLKELLEEEHSA